MSKLTISDMADFRRYYSRRSRWQVRWHRARGHYVRYARTLGLIECLNGRCQRAGNNKWQS